jgi:hypothetical protein
MHDLTTSARIDRRTTCALEITYRHLNAAAACRGFPTKAMSTKSLSFA